MAQDPDDQQLLANRHSCPEELDLGDLFRRKRGFEDLDFFIGGGDLAVANRPVNWLVRRVEADWELKVTQTMAHLTQ